MDYKNKATVSCLGSVYYGSNLEEVKLSIKSLLNSTEKPDEIIIVVDGEINCEIIDFLEDSKNNNLIKVIYSSENIGLGPALNLGLEICKCDLICRFDTDDISVSERISISKKAFEKNSHLDIFGASIVEFIKSDKNFVECNIKSAPLNDYQIKSALDYRNAVNHPTVVFKKNSIKKLGNYENIRFFEDYHLWLKAREKDLIFANTSIPLVLMKRVSHSDRRQGIEYAKYELDFFRKSIQQKLLNPRSFVIFLFRILSRLIPSKYQIIYFLMPWRGDQKSCLNPIYMSNFSLKNLKIIDKFN